jgi:putative transposase
MKVAVGPADKTDAEGAKALLAGLAQIFLRVALLWVDGGYKRRFAEWVTETLGWRVEAVQHPTAGLRVVWVAPGQEPPVLPTGFRVLKRRWVVERTFAWIMKCRRLVRDYEQLTRTAETLITIAAVATLVRRWP